MTKKIAIIGGGFYGSSAAQKLASLNIPDTKITLFTLHEYATDVPASVRLVTGGFKASDITLKYSKFLNKKVELQIVNEIVEFGQSSVTYILRDATELVTTKFDIIIVATGLHWYHPVRYSTIADPTVEGLEKYNAAFKEDVAKAKKIVVVGAGEVGCELVGELAFTFQDELLKGTKELILVHSDTQLLGERIVKKVRASAQNQLANLGVKFKLGNRVEFGKSTDTTLTLTNGEEIKDIDVLFKTTGPTPNVPNTELTQILDKNGYIKVNEYLQTPVSNIFAIGDINNLETKSLKYKEEAIDVVSYNISQLVQGSKNLKKYTKFIKATEYQPVCGISLGPTAGAGQMTLPLIGTISPPGFLVVKMKSKNLFTEKLDEMFGHY